MNNNIIEGKWKQLKGEVQRQWGHITDDEFESIGGEREKLIGTIQENYGVVRDEAENQVKDWETSLNA